MLLADIRDARVVGCRKLLLVGAEDRGAVFDPGHFCH